ncbi:putative sodium-coupled neutral amino acid transporter 11 [Tubulanus polymorphus]|uniref:putative sodium-coupled neutral amino acid transporter 11 n=1 Tax=Tubulanus polymorphus TaxID=672921 RepID=UPI003DA38E73
MSENKDGSRNTTPLLISASTNKSSYNATEEHQKVPLVTDTEAATNSNENLKSGLFGACFNTSNSIIGAGIIGIPYAIGTSGIGLGSILLILTGLINDYSLIILIKAGTLCNKSTYQEVVQAAFGKPGYVVITFVQFLYPYLAMVSYNIIVGDNLTKLAEWIGGHSITGTILDSRQLYIAAANIVIMVPISLFRNVSRLEKFAAFSLSMIILFCAFLIYKLVIMVDTAVPHLPSDWEFAKPKFLQGVSIMAFAYLCHHNAFLIWDSLRIKTTSQWAKITHSSMSFVVVMMAIVGCCGYSTFRSEIQGNILENFCNNDIMANIARLMYTTNIMLTYPLECFVVREVIENVFFKSPQTLLRHVIETIIITGTTLAISLSTDCVSIVLEITGVVTAAPMIFLFPALCYMKLRNEPILSKANVLPTVVVVLGVGVVCVGLYQVIEHLIAGVTCSHGAEMPYCIKTNTTFTDEVSYRYDLLMVS